MAKQTKPNIVMNLDGTVSATTYGPNASRFTWYAVELLSYNVDFAYYNPDVVSMTNTASQVEPGTDYTNTVFITDAYKGINIFNNFKIYDTVTTMDVTDEFVTKVADNMYRIVIPNISSDYMVSFEIIRLKYSITGTLTNCVSDLNKTEYTAGDSLSWTITAGDGNTFDGGTWALTVGGVDITSTGMVLNDDKTKLTVLVTSAQAVGDIVYVVKAVEQASGPFTLTILGSYYAGTAPLSTQTRLHALDSSGQTIEGFDTVSFAYKVTSEYTSANPYDKVICYWDHEETTTTTPFDVYDKVYGIEVMNSPFNRTPWAIIINGVEYTYDTIGSVTFTYQLKGDTTVILGYYAAES